MGIADAVLAAGSLVLASLGAWLILPTISECCSFARRLWTVAEPVLENRQEEPALLFLVLAHDEELLLAACLRSLTVQEYPEGRRRIVVVADNCTDRTADVARAGRVEVMERFSDELRGKPYAIAWALDRIDLSLHDAVIIIDADTEVNADFARALARRSPLRQRALQPFIDVQNPEESALTRMAAIHGVASHRIAYHLKARAGLNVPLGVGMCIGTDLLRSDPWSAFSIAEDVEMYAILTARGVRILPVSDAVIKAQEASSLGQSGPQRHRWMSGKLQILLMYTGRVLRSPHIGLAQRFDAVAELSGFGPAVHLGLVAVGALGAVLVRPPAWPWIAGLLLVSLIRPVTLTFVAIARDPDPAAAIRSFLYLPIYTLWRLGPALRSFARIRGSRWTRTVRHSRPPGPESPP